MPDATPAEQQAALDIMQDPARAAALGKDDPNVIPMSMALQSRMSGIANSSLSGKDKLALVQKSMPSVARLIDALGNNDQAFPTASRSGAYSQFWTDINNLTVAAHPGWNQGQFQSVQKLRDDLTNAGPYGQAITAANRMGFTAAELLSKTNALAAAHGNRYSIPSAVIANFIDGAYTGDATETAVLTAANNFAQEMVRVTRGTGGAEANIDQDIQGMTRAQKIGLLTAVLGTPEQIRTAVQSDIRTATGNINGVGFRFRTQTPEGRRGAPIPGLDPSQADVLTAINRMDPRSSGLTGGGPVPAGLSGILHPQSGPTIGGPWAGQMETYGTGKQDATAQPKKVTSKQDYDALPHGATFTDDKGNQWTKP